MGVVGDVAVGSVNTSDELTVIGGNRDLINGGYKFVMGDATVRSVNTSDELTVIGGNSDLINVGYRDWETNHY